MFAVSVDDGENKTLCGIFTGIFGVYYKETVDCGGIIFIIFHVFHESIKQTKLS